jgi:transcriptional regulator with XRE-family HTH domain
MMTPAQIRAARALLGWSQRDLAERSNVSERTVKSYEMGKSNPVRSTLIAWRNTFAAADVIFLDDDNGHGAGVRFRRPQKA